MVAVVGSLVILGNRIEGSALFHHLLGIAAIKINTGLGLMLAGCALWLQRVPPDLPDDARTGIRKVARLIAFFIVMLGMATIAQDVFKLDLPIDRILLPFASAPDAVPARMAPLTAVCFMLLGTALLSLDRSSKNGHYPAEYCALAAAALMGIPIIGYLYSVSGLVQIASSTAVAPLTSLMFMLLAAGVLCARPRHRLMSLWNGVGPGGQLLRQLLPKSLLVLVLLDLIVEWGARQGLYGSQNVSPLVILLTTGWLTILFWRAALLLNREHDVRRNGEKALSQANALLQAVSDNTPDAIYVRDRFGRMVFANPATLRMLDKDAESVLGCTSYDIYADPEDAQMVDESDKWVMANGRPEKVEETINLPSGTKTFYSTKAPWINEHGELLGLVGISIDITDRKRIENTLRAHETQLEELVAARTAEVTELLGHLEATREEEKRAIARELHDDLGSALTALNMHLAILFRQMPPEPKLTERSVQIKNLIASVTQTTRRIQSGLRPDKLDIFGIKIAISEQALEFENYTGVKCCASLPDEELSYSPQIEIALFRMVQEALNNIAKHAKASQVDVVLDDNEDTIMLSIRDDGVGMPDPQPSGAWTHGLRGMRERAGYLGGEVRIQSTAGKGTTIVISFPKRPASSVANQSAEHLPERRRA